MSALRRAAALACLVVLAATHVPGAPLSAGLALLAAAVVGAGAVGPALWSPLRRLQPYMLPATVGLCVLPPAGTAILRLPWVASAALAVVLLHLSWTENAPPVPSLGGASSRRRISWAGARLGALLGLAVTATVALPRLLPAPLASMSELRLGGAAVLVALLLAVLVVAATLLIQSLRSQALDPGTAEGRR